MKRNALVLLFSFITFSSACMYFDTFDLQGKDDDTVDAINDNNFMYIEHCLKNGLDPNAKPNGSAYSFFFISLQKQKPEIAKLFLKHGAHANQDADHTWTPLGYAIIFNMPELIQPLLDAGADLDKALQCSVTCGWERVCKGLMLLGANPHAKDAEGKTAFDYLHYHWSTSPIKQILKKEDTWRGWLKSKMRSIHRCCNFIKNKQE